MILPHSPHCVWLVDGALLLLPLPADAEAGAAAAASTGAGGGAEAAGADGVARGAGAIGAATIGTAIMGPATGPAWLLVTFIVLVCSLNTRFIFVVCIPPHLYVHLHCWIHTVAEN